LKAVKAIRKTVGRSGLAKNVENDAKADVDLEDLPSRVLGPDGVEGGLLGGTVDESELMLMFMTENEQLDGACVVSRADEELLDGLPIWR
jgi:hypothetical protein